VTATDTDAVPPAPSTTEIMQLPALLLDVTVKVTPCAEPMLGETETRLHVPVAIVSIPEYPASLAVNVIDWLGRVNSSDDGETAMVPVDGGPAIVVTLTAVVAMSPIASENISEHVPAPCGVTVNNEALIAGETETMPLHEPSDAENTPV